MDAGILGTAVIEEGRYGPIPSMGEFLNGAYPAYPTEVALESYVFRSNSTWRCGGICRSIPTSGNLPVASSSVGVFFLQRDEHNLYNVYINIVHSNLISTLIVCRKGK